jgi:hypothetical protein
MMRGTFGPGTIVLGGGAVLLIGFLTVGFLMPSAWEASAEVVVDVPATALMPLLDSPEGWRAWTTWPDSGLTRSGPPRGTGATLAWNDPELGSGAFTVEAASTDRAVTYSVEVAGVGGAAMRTSGEIRLEEHSDGGTLVRWHEEGDLGRNPLMGYWARSMRRVQSAEMAKALDRLAEAAVTAVEAESPRDH